MHTLSLVLVSRGYSSCSSQVSHCNDFPSFRTQAPGLQSSVFAVHRLSCPAARAIFLDQGLNMWLLYWQADSEPLYHHYQESPGLWFYGWLLFSLSSFAKFSIKSVIYYHYHHIEYVYTHMCIYEHIYMYTCIHIYNMMIWTYIHTCVCLCVC